MRNGLFRRNRIAAIIAATAVASTAQAQESTSRYQLVEEVVVTAQKREENFMSVPVTVNAFTAQDMINTGAATIQDIDSFIPGVEIGDTVGGTTQVGITVRGVSSPNISSGQDPSVSRSTSNAFTGARSSTGTAGPLQTHANTATKTPTAAAIPA